MPKATAGLVVAGWLIAGLATAAPDAAPAATKVAEGDAALAKLDLAGAMAAYTAAVDSSPNDYEALWKLARALADEATLAKDSRAQKDLCIRAEKLARKSVSVKPNDSKGHAYLAVAVGKLALFEGGKRKVELSKEVKAEAERALQCNADDDVALHVLAIWNREMVELSWFLKSFAQVLYGKFPPASLDTALADLRRAVQLRPDVIPHHVELGITLASAKRWPEAKTELEKGLALPTGWVTDDYYRALGRQNLARVQAHLR